ncbi:MAG: glycosyltransferase [Flavobacterium sp.]|nr:glycosyltransferase [Flavobacterium sp.]
MIKVLHVTGAMNRGGAEVMLMDIFRNIGPQFHFDFLINYNKKKGIVAGDFDTEILSTRSTLFYIPTQWEIGPLNYCKEFKKLVQESKPDIVHIHMNSKSGVIALAAKMAGVKHVITHAHADIKFRGSFIYKMVSNLEMKFQKFLINKYSDQYWGCSLEANKSLFYFSKLNNENSAIINNAVAVQQYQEVSLEESTSLRKTYKIGENTLILGNVGRIVQHKNVLFIVEVLNELKIRGIDFVFVFAGRADQAAYLEEINAKIDAYHLKNNVIYLGLRDDIPVVMNSLDVFVGPALKEGFGLVAVEAQAAGIPCVLYTGFPQSVDMQLNLVTFLDSFIVAPWADAILEVKNQRCTDKALIRNRIIELGFDSVSNSKIIGERYKNIENV